MSAAFDKLAARRAHLERGNLLRSLTEVIDKVPGGINLGQGVCDLDTPGALVRGALESIEGADRQTYTPYMGLPGLREQIARQVRSLHGIEVDPEGVLVTAGASGAFFAAATTLCEPGDEVVLFEPFYPYHRSALQLVGAKPVFVRLRGDDLALDEAALRAAITPRTRAIVINTPANPSGKMFDAAELRAIAGVLAGTDIAVLTDEVYEHMCYDGRRHVPPATIAGLAERCLTIGSYSKTFSITGWRIGYLIGPPALAQSIGLVCDQIMVCVARPMQRGVERALRELPRSFYTDLQTSYREKRDRFCDALSAGGFRLSRPAGAYYVLADYRDVYGDIDPHAAVLQMIERIGINGVPGHVFYDDPTDIRTIRFHFAVTPAVLDEACQRVRSPR